MPCFAPLQGYRSRTLSPNGKRSIVFTRKNAYVDLTISVPCGQCIGCRLERSRQWAIRCSHEAQMHAENSFITLTYSDDHLPADRSLDLRAYQLFMKRLRKRTGPVRFYHCGEYGEQFGRPHYHACLFGFDFPDKKSWQVINGNTIYRSALLEDLWPFGYSSIGAVTFQSAAYVARYILKKITGEAAQDHYEYIDPETGEITQRKPEYTTMSRRPGIGRPWLDKFLSDVYPGDFVVVNGAKMRPPKFYDYLYEIEYPSDHRLIKSSRVRNALKHVDNNTPERLLVRESVQKSKLKLLPRNIE